MSHKYSEITQFQFCVWNTQHFSMNIISYSTQTEVLNKTDIITFYINLYVARLSLYCKNKSAMKKNVLLHKVSIMSYFQNSTTQSVPFTCIIPPQHSTDLY